MGQTYTLKLQNNSTDWVFAVYTMMPTFALSEGNENAGFSLASQFPIAWLAKRVNAGNFVEYEWSLDFSVAYAAQGCQAGAKWRGGKPLDMNPNSESQNSAKLSYSGDYRFELSSGAHPVKPDELYIDADATVPQWKPDEGPSVALAIATGSGGTPTPAIATDSGPNINHMFTLHPEYYIQAGRVEQGVMVDITLVTPHQRVTYSPGVYEASWTLTPSNTWVAGNQCT